MKLYIYITINPYLVWILACSIKVMQLSTNHNQFHVKGYGVANFEESSIVNGVIDNYESIASSMHNMFFFSPQALLIQKSNHVYTSIVYILKNY